MRQTRSHIAIRRDIYNRIKSRAAAEDRSVKFVAERCLADALDRIELDEQASTEARLTDIQVYVNIGGNVTIANSSNVSQCGNGTSIDHENIDVLIYKLEQIRSDFLLGIYDSKEAA